MIPNKMIVRRLIPLLLLGAFFRFAELGEGELWGDELLSATGSYLPAGMIVAEARRPQSDLLPVEPPGYCLLNKWVGLVIAEPGEAMFTATGRFGLRLISALLGALLPVLVYLLARRLADPARAWLPALLAAFSFYGIYYSRENRPYMAVAFLALLSTLLFVEIFLAGRRRLWPFYAMSLAGLGYLTYPAIMVGGIHAAGMILIVATRSPYRNGKSEIRRVGRKDLLCFAGAGALALLLFLPWLPHTFSMAFSPDLFHSAVGDGAQGRQVPWRLILATLSHWGCGNWGSLALYGSTAAVGWLAVFRRNRAAAWLLLMFYLAPFGYLSVSSYGAFFHPRYLIFSYPIHLLLAGLGVAEAARLIGGQPAGRRLRRWAARATVVLLLAAMLVHNILALGMYYQYDIKCSADNCPYETFCREYIEPPG